MFDVAQALRELVEKEGSDLHLKVGSAPLFRVHGGLAVDQSAGPLTAQDTRGALTALLSDERKLEEFEHEREVDFWFEIPDVDRYRVNALQQSGLIYVACRESPPRKRV